MTKKRRRCVHLNVMVTPEEQELIYERMAEAGIQNMGAYMRKMALNGYVLHVDLADVRELVSLQRRCANNLNVSVWLETKAKLCVLLVADANVNILHQRTHNRDCLLRSPEFLAEGR